MFLALAYLLPNLNTVTLAIADCVEQTCNDSSTSDVEEKDCKDIEINTIPNPSFNELFCKHVTLNYIQNQVPVKPVLKQPTPPPQA